MTACGTVRLVKAEPETFGEMMKALQEAFAPAVQETFGPRDYGPIPPDEDVRASFQAPGAVVYHLVSDGKRIGGAVVNIDEASGHNTLELFFIAPEYHGRGLGLAAWRALEARYPQTRVWETVTPYFEKRNIHFYVNCCGFHIVEFFNAHHVDPSLIVPRCPDGLPLPGMDEYFRFRKVMVRNVDAGEQASRDREGPRRGETVRDGQRGTDARSDDSGHMVGR